MSCFEMGKVDVWSRSLKLNVWVLIGNTIGVEGCRMISEALKKESRLVGLNLLGKKEEG